MGYCVTVRDPGDKHSYSVCSVSSVYFTYNGDLVDLNNLIQKHDYKNEC